MKTKRTQREPTALRRPTGERKPSARSTSDLFLSYHGPDRDAVRTVRQILAARGIRTFLDRENLVPGQPWPQALEGALRDVEAVAVFLGPHGLGAWQKREMFFALDRQAQEEQAGRAFPVIPVLLSGADPTSGFLFLNTWVDLRRDLTDPEALETLVRAIRRATPSQQAAQPEDVLAALPPYQGLRVFREEHAAFFFGREAFAERLRDAVLSRNLVTIIGTSGSGKSSVVQAGLLPMLRRQRPPGRTWDAIVFTPGDHPFHRLATALIPLLEPDASETDRLVEAQKLGDRLAMGEVRLEAAVERLLAKSEGTDRLLVVADQFEELFTQTPESDRKRFVDVMLAGLDRAPLTLLPTLRADFYEHSIALSRDLSHRLEQSVLNLGPMTAEELKRAIVEPACRVGLDFQPGLVDRILDDVGEEPGNLPLLEFALTELWAHRQDRLLTHAAYEEIGEVAGAIARRAEAEFAKFTPEQQAMARRVFVCLVRVARPDEGALDTRQRARVAELALGSGGGFAARSVVHALADARLLVTGRDGAIKDETVEVAHEALIRGWERLQNWLHEDREFLLWRQRLRAAAAEWERTRRDEGTLLRGVPLTEAGRWLSERSDDLGQDEREFIERSAALKAREEDAKAEQLRREREALERLAATEAQRAQAAQALAHSEGRARIRQRYFSAGLFGLLILALLIAAHALDQRYIGRSRELAASALAHLPVDPELSVLLAMKAARTRSTAQAEDALRQSLLGSPVRAVMRGHGHPVTGAAFSPDGKWVVTAGADGTARVWDTGTWEPGPELPGRAAGVIHAAFSPDGTLVVTPSGSNLARVWDVRTGERKHELGGHTARVTVAAFSPRAARAVTAGADGTVRIWDTGTWGPVAELPTELPKDTDAITGAAISPDGTRVVTVGGDATPRLWHVGTDNAVQWVDELRGHTKAVHSAAISPDGTRVVTASADQTARVWEASTGTPVVTFRGHTYDVYSAAFSPDGHFVVTASGDKTARVWDVSTGQSVDVLRGHTDWVGGAAFSPDGKQVVTAGGDKTARVWEVSPGLGLAVLRGHTGTVWGAAFSPDGRRVATTGEDQTARIWDAETGERLSTLPGPVTSAAFSSDGRLMLAARGDGTAQVMEPHTGKEQAILHGYPDRATGAAISRDGKRVAAAGEDWPVRVWELDAQDRMPTGPELTEHADIVKSMAFSPDGTLLATASSDGTARIWDVASRKRVGEILQHPEGVFGVAFSPDGGLVVTACLDGVARVWQVDQGKLEAELRGHRDIVNSATFSPDGKWVVTASDDRTARIWELSSRKVVAELRGHTTWVARATFSSDGERLVTTSQDGTARIYKPEVYRSIEELLDLARTRVKRDFTPEERKRLLDER